MNTPEPAAPEQTPIPSSPQAVVVDRESGYRWLLWTWVVVAAFFLVAVGRSLQVGIPFKDPHLAYFWGRVAMCVGILVPLAIVDALVRARRSGLGARGIGRALAQRWTRRRSGLILLGIVGYCLTYWTYHNLKSWDVFNTVRDTMLLGWDRAIFFGHSPAVLLHDLLGERVAAHVLAFVYDGFTPVTMVGLLAAPAFCARVREAYVFLVAGMWGWILGVASYYLIPTDGPFASAPREFAGLAQTSIQTGQQNLLTQKAYMLAHPHAHDAWAAISAFASLHVGVTTLTLLMAYYYRARVATIFMAVWVPLTMVATVYWGYHFFVDDLAGLLLAWLSVQFAVRMLHPGRPWEFLPRRPLESTAD